jgi:hypothetical protein
MKSSFLSLTRGLLFAAVFIASRATLFAPPIQNPVVTTTADTHVNGQMTLREALDQTNAAPGGTITFSNTTANGATNFQDGQPRTIVLTGGTLTVSGSVTITGPGANRLAVSGNSAVRVFTVNSGPTVILAGLTIKDGFKNDGGGGIDNSGTLTIQNCTISGNASGGSQDGGGILNENGATLKLQNCTVSGNSAGNSGGGIQTLSDTVTIQNCTIAGNTARGPGGGICGGAVKIQNSTITGNSVGNNRGGGIDCQSLTSLILENSIVAGNTAGSRPDIATGVAITSNGHNFIGTTAGISGGVQAGDKTFANTGKTLPDLLETEAGVPVLKSNGGPTLTIAVVPGSPAIDAGDNPSASNAGLTTDQRGFGRAQPFASGGPATVDIGAVEMRSFLVTTTADTHVNGQTTLREALTQANAAGGNYITYSKTTAGGAVNFHDGTARTITVTGSAVPPLTSSVTITGPGEKLLAVSGNHLPNVPVFSVDQGKSGTFIGLTIKDGNAPLGGGIYNYKGTLTIQHCTLTGHAASVTGGAIYSDGVLTIQSCTISGNTAGEDGGGISIDNGSTGTLLNSVISGNSAESGGGIKNAAATLTIQNSTITGNSATSSRGGGIANGGKLKIQNSTITGNSAPSANNGIAGGILCDSTIPLILENSIVAGNTAGFRSPDIEAAAASATSVSSNGFNFIGNTTGISNAGALTDKTFASTGKTLADLLQTDANGKPVLADHGGSTFTVALVSGSPALDAGDNTAATNAGLTTDQRGLPRAVQATAASAIVDLGAYEAILSPVVKNTNDSGPDSLREVVKTIAPGGTVTFADGTGGTTNFQDATPDTITLTNGEIVIDKSLTLAGSGAKVLTVARSSAGGTPDFRVLRISNGTTTGPTVAISGLTIANGKATGGVPDTLGGGIYNDHGTLALDKCTFSQNHAEGDGGGIWNGGEAPGRATLTVTNCTFTQNSAGVSAGAIFNWGGDAGNATLTILNSTFSQQSAGRGSDLYNYGYGGLAVLEARHSTFSQAPVNSGIVNDGRNAGQATLRLAHTILKSAGLIFDNDEGTITSLGYNLSSDAAGGNGATGPGGFLNGTGDQRNTDPLLEKDPNDLTKALLKDNGGATFTIALLPGSPAIDAGDPNFAPADFTPALTTDQRGTGFARVLRGASASKVARVDLGAWEAPATPVRDDFAFAIGKQTIAIDVLANDDARAGVAIAILTAPQFGTATIVGGKVSYVPNTALLPAKGDRFTYSYDDGHGGTGTATVTVQNFDPFVQSYDGLVGGETNAAPSVAPVVFKHDRYGYVQVALNRLGSVSGSLTLGGSVTYTFTGTFDAAGKVLRTITRAPQAPITLTLQLDAANGWVTGTAASKDLDQLDFTSPILAKPRAAAGNLAGNYTLLVQAPAAVNLAPPVQPEPLGAGYARVVIAANGNVTTTGKMADGAPFSCATYLHADRSFPVYGWLYSGAYLQRGSVRGSLSFPSGVVRLAADATGTFTWAKLNRPADPIFRGGFTTTRQVLLARYVVPTTTNRRVLAFSDPSPNGTATFAKGGFAGFSQDFNLQTYNLVVPVLPARPNGTLGRLQTLNFDTVTGIFRGNFLNPASKKVTAFEGAVFQANVTGSGFFLGAGTNEAGDVEIAGAR